MDRVELVKAFGAFFAIMNPFVNLPFFLALTTGFTVAQQRWLALRVILYCVVMCGTILLAGRQIIGFFGITVDQFRVAGGLVLAHIAWSMLNGAPAASHHGSADEGDRKDELSDLAFYPMAFPMLVGPGTIATLIIYGGNAHDAAAFIGLTAVVALILAMVFLVMYFAADLGKTMSATARATTMRLMGMILLAIAVDMIIVGLAALLPGLVATT